MKSQVKNVKPDLKSFIRDIPDFPKKGIVFKDITPLLASPEAFMLAVQSLTEPFRRKGIKNVAVIESRGFLLGAPVAIQLESGLVPIRKKGKLPHKTISVTYALEYGEDTLEMHEDAVLRNTDVLIVDDVLATGGTAQATCQLIEKAGGRVAGLAFLMELSFLKGREKLQGYPIVSLMTY